MWRPTSLRWRIVAALFFPFLGLVVSGAAIEQRLNENALRSRAQERLLTARDRAALALETRVSETRADLAALADDPRTVTAFKRLRRATRELDGDPAAAPRAMPESRAVVRDYLRRYYADELRRNELELDAMIVPERAAIWLQALYFGQQVEGEEGTATRRTASLEESLYETENQIWQPIFESLVERFGWQDLLLADISDGRVLYSVSKSPEFQTSLIDGPYAESGLGSLFRELQGTRRGAARLSDSTPFVPAHGLPVSFAGVPVFDGTTRLGVLLVRQPPDWIAQVLSAQGHWSAVGLGETGDLFVIGPDSRMRSRSRFFDELRSVSPDVERRGMTVSAFDIESVSGPGTAQVSLLRYVNHRGVPVFGLVKRLEIPELPWSLVAEIESAEALAPVSVPRESLFLIVLGVLLLGLLVIAAIVTWLLRPLTDVVDTLRAVRHGDTKVRVPAQTVGQLGELGEAVNELIATHADWIGQEAAERHQREAEVQELTSVLRAFARGDVSQPARIDGHLAGLASAVNAMGKSLGKLTDRLCMVPPRVAENAYAMQTLADRILEETAQQTQGLEPAATAATEMIDWLHGCTADARGLVDAAARVEELGEGMVPSTGGAGSSEDASIDELHESDSGSTVTARYRRLRTNVEKGESLRSAIRNAVDVARHIRTAAEALRGHAQTLQLVALDLHAQGGGGRGSAVGGATDSASKDALGTTPPHTRI